jgi:hypothetical protein
MSFAAFVVCAVMSFTELAQGSDGSNEREIVKASAELDVVSLCRVGCVFDLDQGLFLG